jgi:hypothetical protein
MTTSAQAIYRSHLTEILGENSPITIQAIIDPTGLNETVYGVLDDVDYQGNKDSANVRQFLDGRRFILSSVPVFDVYDNKQIFFTDLNLTYTIKRLDTDLNGAQVLWVY